MVGRVFNVMMTHWWWVGLIHIVDDNHDYIVLMVDGVVLMIIAKQEALQIILLY